MLIDFIGAQQHCHHLIKLSFIGQKFGTRIVIILIKLSFIGQNLVLMVMLPLAERISRGFGGKSCEGPVQLGKN